MADALGGEIDQESYEIAYNAAASDVATALEATSADLGHVDVTKTVSGIDRHVGGQQAGCRRNLEAQQFPAWTKYTAEIESAYDYETFPYRTQVL